MNTPVVMVRRSVRKATGWALIVASVGMLYDDWSGWALGTDGSVGLIPAYVGMLSGLLGLSYLIWKVGGTAAGVLAVLGTAGTLVFWGSYPSYATAGGLGALLIGVSVLFLPSWARFASPLWVSSGILGITELVRPGIGWGPISGWTLLAVAFATTGAFALWGLDPTSDSDLVNAP